MIKNIDEKLINRVLSLYGINDADIRILPFQAGYRNNIVPVELKSKQKLALIFYKAEAGILKKIKTANYVSDYLALKNWPTRQVKTAKNHKQTIVQIAHKNKRFYCCLYNYLPGQTINWESYSKKHLKLLGQVLGYLHADLSEIEDRSMNLFDKEILNLEKILKEMNTYFKQDEVLLALEQKLKIKINFKIFVQFEQLLSALSKIENQQVLHLDFVRGNILFDRQKITPNNQKFALVDDGFQPKNQSLTISAVLDFEKTSVGPLILDLSRTLAFLLIDCKHKSEYEVKKLFLNAGYYKRGQQNLPDIHLLNITVAFYLFYDFYKFLKHNPYEFLEQNEHFVRTKDWLIRQKLLISNL